MIRLTGGQMRGRGLAPKGLGKKSKHGVLRATSSKVREALFNILGPRINDAVFVDFYAGSGTVGMEAMSRGACTVYFVEADRVRASAIEHLLEGCGCSSKAVIVNKAALDFIKLSGDGSVVFDICFLDPPYETTEFDTVLPALGSSPAIKEGTIVIVEHSKRLGMPASVGPLTHAKTYKYGDTVLTAYRS